MMRSEPPFEYVSAYISLVSFFFFFLLQRLCGVGGRVTVSQVLIPRSNARLSIGSAWASGSVQLIDLDGSPNVMVPKITLETFRPDFPSLEI
jgi:hypothetical protein